MGRKGRRQRNPKFKHSAHHDGTELVQSRSTLVHFGVCLRWFFRSKGYRIVKILPDNTHQERPVSQEQSIKTRPRTSQARFGLESGPMDGRDFSVSGAGGGEETAAAGLPGAPGSYLYPPTNGDNSPASRLLSPVFCLPSSIPFPLSPLSIQLGGRSHHLLSDQPISLLIYPFSGADGDDLDFF